MSTKRIAANLVGEIQKVGPEVATLHHRVNPPGCCAKNALARIKATMPSHLRVRPPQISLLAVLAVLALVPRLALIVADAGRPLVGDERSYDAIAINVASGHGYQVGSTEEERRPTAVRGPGYVLVLAAFYRVFGHDPMAPLIAQAFMDAGCVLLVYVIARRWFGPPIVGLVAGVLYAVYPPFILSTASLLTEPLTHFTLLFAVWRFFEYLEHRRARDFVLSAVFLGLCALSKPQLAPVGVILCLVSTARLGLSGAVRATAGMIAVITLVLAPWMLRNAMTFKTLVPGVSQGGMGLYLGAGPIDGRVIGGLDAPGVPDSLRSLVGAMSELEANRWAAAEARRLIAADPGAYAVLSMKKFFQLWFNLGYDTRPSRASLMVALANLAACVLALVGARAASPRHPAAIFMVFLAVFWTVVNVPFATVVRYAYPYLALLFVFTAAGIVTLARPAVFAQVSRDTPSS